jgi:Ca2+-binding RTX toxin-like protein
MALISGTSRADVLTGVAGETDQFIINNAGDQILGSEGRDIVVSSITFDMAASNAQYLVLTGRAAIDATGTDKAEVIAGNTGDNLLNGGRGQDRLIGGRGADTFVFDAHGQLNADIIEDFSRAQGDTMALSGEAFGVAAGTALDFAEGAALGAGPTVFRDAGSQLWFDADGIGDGAAVVFAQSRAQGLDSSCFAVI